ncbi:MAG: histidine--tRNA ligase [Planctomycetes bacterium]|nr:histidine--tRNA ligase [Planctomycetota bacterium]
MSKIQPRTLKGFRDYLPAAAIAREALIDQARAVYRSYGFVPIDTPALEYLEILAGKGGDESDKQMYRFTDAGGREVGMRFDLTIPFARFAAQHIGELGTPFKRYHVGTVWRGENTQRGRYREFMQCDFDTIGTESLVSDVETLLVIHDLVRAVGIDDFVVRVNNRKVLSGLLERLELSDRATAVLRALDKLDKVGPDKVAEEMVSAAGASAAQAREVLAMAALTGTDAEVLAALRPLVAGSERGERGVEELAGVLAGAAAAGVPAERVRLDVSIARGLDYYTGTIYETFLGELPAIGSICSGGRYDNLAELYTKQELPGIGASLGVDRLLSALEELGRVDARACTAPIFVPYFVAERRDDYLALCARLRAAGFAVELYPEPKKLGAQLKYADRRGFRCAVIVGERELDEGRCQVKLLATGENADVTLEGLVEHLRALAMH